MFNHTTLYAAPLDTAGQRIYSLPIAWADISNHFNPNNPNTTLTYNVANAIDSAGRIDMSKVTQANQTNSNFGVITGAQVGARRMILSARFRF
jgi:hypothetical protein